MRLRFWNQMLLLCLAWSLPMLAQDDDVAQDDDIVWLDNYGKAIEESKRTQKPIFLEYRCEP